MKLISTSQELTLVSGGGLLGGLQNMMFSLAGAGIGSSMGRSMVFPVYSRFGVLIGGSIGGVVGYAVSSMVQFFESSAYDIIDSIFNKKS